MTVYDFITTRQRICWNAPDCSKCALSDVCTPISSVMGGGKLDEKKLKALISRVSKIIANEKRRTNNDDH